MGSAADGWSRVKARQKAGADLIVVDPRRTPSAEQADLHVSIRPGQDWAFSLALIKVIDERGWTNAEDCSDAAGTDLVLAQARGADLADLVDRCGVPVAVIEDVARRFATARTSMAWHHTGVTMNTTGTVGCWLVHVLNLICGRIDRPGGRRHEPGPIPFPKIVKLSSKRNLPPSRVRGLPKVLGTTSLAELPDEILEPGKGRIRALICDSGNPVVSGPDGTRMAEALADMELLVVVDLVQRESHRDAHWLIPAYHWLERDELNLFFHLRGATVHPVRIQGRRCSAHGARRMGVLHRARADDEAPALRDPRRQHLHQDQPAHGPAHPAARPGVQPSLGDLADAALGPKAALERHQGAATGGSTQTRRTAICASGCSPRTSASTRPRRSSSPSSAAC